jgi:hypothetical protein
MKGFTEIRGQAFKLEFDFESGQFEPKPIVHAFTSKPGPRSNVDDLAALRRPKPHKKAKTNIDSVSFDSTVQPRDAFGVTRVFSPYSPY